MRRTFWSAAKHLCTLTTLNERESLPLQRRAAGASSFMHTPMMDFVNPSFTMCVWNCGTH